MIEEGEGLLNTIKNTYPKIWKEAKDLTLLDFKITLLAFSGATREQIKQIIDDNSSNNKGFQSDY